MAGSNASLGVQLDNPPADGVTALRFSTNSDLLLASSWDGMARLYDPLRNSLRGSYSHQAPVLDTCFQDDSIIYTAGLDCLVKRYDFFGRMESIIGGHNKPVRCLEVLRDSGVVVSGSWDSTLRLWDPRLPQGQNCVALIGLPGKVFTMSAVGTRLVVGTSGRHVLVYDIRGLSSGSPEQQRPEQHRESSLKYQMRCIRCFPDGTGFALSSVEGRVAIEYFDQSEAVQAKKYAFKCHRKSEGGKDVVYPVNTMAFHPVFGTFVTGGCDGVVNIWDGKNQKRLFQIANYPTSIAAAAFSRDGTHLAVASSYTYEMGEREHPGDSIFVREMNEVEVKPKPRKAS
ncbi:hypothetical protein WJX72_008544 [[Myrmecia] bisecta]|uniref:Mitotic checkpoint protein BUB3 n=1 Tax=[Myrmecia] bisecta TaxID=41462 RepID=A0AAW1Q0N5_9CHLO